MMPRAVSRGIAMTEFILLSGMLAVASTVCAEFLLRQSDLVYLAVMQNDLHLAAQQAMEAVVTDLRPATRAAAGSPPNATIPAPPGNTTLTLYVPADLDEDGDIVDAGGAIEWSPAPIVYQLNQQQLLRTQGGATRVLANDVTGLAFEDQAIDGTLAAEEIRVRLTLQAARRGRTTTVSRSAVVNLRN